MWHLLRHGHWPKWVYVEGSYKRGAFWEWWTYRCDVCGLERVDGDPVESY